MPFVALYDKNKQELRGRGYRRADMRRDKMWRRPLFRWPPTTARWPLVYYIGIYKRNTDTKPLTWGPLPHPRLARKGDTLIVHIDDLPDIMRKIKRGRPF